METTANQGFKVLHTQPTPNPDAVQFIINAPAIAAEVTKTFANAGEAKGDALGEALFNIFGVENVFFKENFVTVSKSPVTGWNSLIEPITKVLEDKLTFITAAMAEPVHRPAPAEEGAEITPETFQQLPDEQKLRVIDALLDRTIRPALAYDGGGLTLQGVQGNVVQLHYQGACGGCPSAQMGTLNYIETMLKENLHPDIEVRAS